MKPYPGMYLSQPLGCPVPAGLVAEEITVQTDEHRQRLLALRPRPK
jgi:enoyl-CoA hydratase